MSLFGDEMKNSGLVLTGFSKTTQVLLRVTELSIKGT